MCYAVFWYVLCRAGMRYAVALGMCYAVVLWITHIAVWTDSLIGCRMR